jgi:hypothetical protein
VLQLPKRVRYIQSIECSKLPSIKRINDEYSKQHRRARSVSPQNLLNIQEVQSPIIMNENDELVATMPCSFDNETFENSRMLHAIRVCDETQLDAAMMARDGKLRML